MTSHYPGLGLRRFLKEIQDILILWTKNPVLNLELSHCQISERVRDILRTQFLQGFPFAYLTKSAEFYGHVFYVDENVLVPRPETELLVDHVVNMTKNRNRSFDLALDVGTGSGVILLSLLANDCAQKGVGVDISSLALDVAHLNARRLRVQNCQFLLSDRLSAVQDKFDLIISNPPYIKKRAHFQKVHSSVDKFEPHQALYLQDDTYQQWFHDFFVQVKSSLLPQGVFLMEGHELELQEQSQSLKDLGFERVQVLKDYAGLDRFLLGHGS